MELSKQQDYHASVTTIDSVGKAYNSQEMLTTKIARPSTKNATDSATTDDAPATATAHHGPDHPTNYVEALMHLLRGHIGSGLFAMGDAFRNGGLVLGVILTLFLGIVCLHNQHVLIKCARRVRQRRQLTEPTDFARTVQLCFELGAPRLRRFSGAVLYVVNTFICATQIGFCCVYFVFATETLQQVFHYYQVAVPMPVVPMVIVAVPIVLPSMILNLKYLAPASTIANVCMAVGIGVVFYYAFAGLTAAEIVDRRYVGTVATIPLYFGTAMFAFEGIALILPLKNSMRKTEQFEPTFGVLNVGICTVTVLYITFGFMGYYRWGEDVEASVTLNLPQDQVLAQVVKLAVAFGMCLTFSLQFFVPIQIILPTVQRWFAGRCANETVVEVLFRLFMVAVAIVIGILVPHLDKIISLIGALCATALALFFPILCQLVLAYGSEDKADHLSAILVAKNGLIMLFALFGLLTGTYQSISGLIEEMSK